MPVLCGSPDVSAAAAAATRLTRTTSVVVHFHVLLVIRNTPPVNVDTFKSRDSGRRSMPGRTCCNGCEMPCRVCHSRAGSQVTGSVIQVDSELYNWCNL